jgi:hypothetical protein
MMDFMAIPEGRGGEFTRELITERGQDLRLAADIVHPQFTLAI